MKILHVITGLGKAAGTSTFCGEVCNRIAARGHDVTIAVCDPAAPDSYPLDKRVRLVSIESVLHSSTLHSCYDIIHIHGLWSFCLHKIVKKIYTLHRTPTPSTYPSLIWSTHGMTAPWSLHHKWWKKFLPWHLYQKRDLKRAQLIHCTSDFEVDWNKKLGFKNCFVAPLGTSLPNLPSTPTPKADTSTSKTLLFVGRIYPVKALDRLIEAFAKVIHSPTPTYHSNWILRIVGPDQAGHMAELMALCDRLGIPYSKSDSPSEELELEKGAQFHSPPPTLNSNSTRPLVVFAGPKFGQDLDDEYANCDCLALVSHTENFGATVVDAMAHGKPVITSTKTPWKVVADNKCGWWVSKDIEPLSAALVELMTKSDAERMEMGVCGRKLAEWRYTWTAVCDKMVRGYEEALKSR